MSLLNIDPSIGKAVIRGLAGMGGGSMPRSAYWRLQDRLTESFDRGDQKRKRDQMKLAIKDLINTPIESMDRMEATKAIFAISQKYDLLTEQDIMGLAKNYTSLRDYFENRDDQEKIKVFYIDGHFTVNNFVEPFHKATKISLKQLSSVLQLSLFKIITGMIGAKLHKVNFKSIL